MTPVAECYDAMKSSGDRESSRRAAIVSSQILPNRTNSTMLSHQILTNTTLSQCPNIKYRYSLDEYANAYHINFFISITASSSSFSPHQSDPKIPSTHAQNRQ